MGVEQPEEVVEEGLVFELPLTHLLTHLFYRGIVGQPEVEVMLVGVQVQRK